VKAGEWHWHRKGTEADYSLLLYYSFLAFPLFSSLFCSHLTFFFRFQFRSCLLFLFPFLPLTLTNPSINFIFFFMLKKTCCFTSATLGFLPIGTISLLFPLFHCVSCCFLFPQCGCLPYWSSAHLQLGFLLSLTVNLNWFRTTSSLLCGL